MALIKCSECGRKISDKATICPICGCPVENNKSCDSVENEESEIIVATAQPQRKRNKKVVVFILLIMLFIIGSILTFKGLYKSHFENCAYSTAVALKEILKNPDSLSIYDVEFYVSRVDTNSQERNTITDSKHPIVIMHYTAQNGYGGNTTGYVVATYHKDSSRYEIDGYTYTLNASEISKYEDDVEWKKLTIMLIKSCRKNNEKIGDIDVKKLNRRIKKDL